MNERKNEKDNGKKVRDVVDGSCKKFELL